MDGIIPSNPVVSLAIARQKRSHGRIVPNHSAFRKRNRIGEHSQRQEVTKLGRVTTWPRIANAHEA